MLFWRGKPHRFESAVLIEVSPRSVAGGYGLYLPDRPPALLYSERVALKPHRGEADESAVARALTELGGSLIKNGAPELARRAGSGRADSILVSVTAPWQETVVRTQNEIRDAPFTFTRAVAAQMLEQASEAPPGKLLVDDTIVSALLNGYELADPYNKKASRVSIVALISFIDEQVARSITRVLHGLYHTDRILPIAATSLRYQAIRAAFPHEDNALIIDTAASGAAITLVRNGFLVGTSELPTARPKEWLARITEGLAEIVKQCPLPRTIFLIATDEDGEDYKKQLTKEALGSLWLSEDPPNVVLVLPSHLGTMTTSGNGPADLELLLMLLYGKQYLHEA